MKLLILLAGVHASREGLRGNLLLDGTLDRGHGHVGNAAVVEPLLEVVPLALVRCRIAIQVDLHRSG